jgi:Tfp pilus assembly protein PilO
MATQQSFSWPDAAAVTALALAAVALVGFAIAGYVQLRSNKIKAGQEDELRQLVRRYEHLAENTFDAQQRTATDLSEMRSRTVSIEQILRTVE